MYTECLPRFDVIDELRIADFGNDTALLKGSTVRGDFPFDDIDIMLIGSGEQPTDMPGHIKGIPVAYSRQGPTDFMNYVRDVPRAWNMVNEALVLQAPDPEVGSFLDTLRDDIRSELSADLVAYLIAEDVVNRNRSDLTAEEGYYAFKRLPGSKRTVMRTIYLLQGMYPDLYDFDGTTPKLEFLEKVGLIDDSTVLDIYTVLSLLAEGRVGDERWSSATSAVNEWSGHVAEQAGAYIGPRLPGAYLDLLGECQSGEDAAKLEDLFGRLSAADTGIEPYRQWTLLALLSANPHIGSDTLRELFEHALVLPTGRAIARYAIRNAAFPIVDVMHADRAYPSHLKKSLTQRYAGALALSQS